ncbi:MAG: RNA polymerase sigma factor [Firmicutes bacterium]|nr:RNA polymerase sigma factor [Bacillota bacterium]NLZ92528.1 RNA polymerase sigma factor [Bacillota bacterium]
MKKSKLLDDLYSQYRYLMYHVAYGILKDHNSAEDAVQAAFLKLAKNNYQINEINCNKTKAFMVIVIRSTAFDLYSSNNKHQNLSYLEDQITEAVDNNPTPLELIISNNTIDTIKNTFQTMNSKYADVLILKYFYDYTNKEIANLLLISEENVRVRLHRARKILVASLTKRGIGHEQRHTK